MTHDARRLTLIFSALCATLVCALLAARAQAPQAGGLPKTASQQFKNIKVLKDIPADQLIPAMQFITASLGVECEYCHVEHAFDKDDKKTKLAARKMMEMMLTINSENFDNHRVVTCYTCHQGGAKPVGIPVIADHEKMPEMMAGEATAASANPDAIALLDQYLAAVGGADALKKISTRVAKGTATAFGDQKLPVEIYAQAPDDALSSTVLGRQLVELLALALDRRSEVSQGVGSSVRMAHRRRAEEVIRRNLSEGAMSPETVAEACGISKRYLHELFADVNYTVSQFMREQRLQAARDVLQMPNPGPMSDIAYRFGFSDQAQFSRLFKAMFGQTPSGFRAQVVAPGDQD